MSLREEIGKEIQKLSTQLTVYISTSFMEGEHKQELAPQYLDVYVQNIISKIEKRIDERISSYENKDTLYESVVQRIAGMKEVKEMLRNDS